MSFIQLCVFKAVLPAGSQVFIVGFQPLYIQKDNTALSLNIKYCVFVVYSIEYKSNLYLDSGLYHHAVCEVKQYVQSCI